jgi:hypothetical protein
MKQAHVVGESDKCGHIRDTAHGESFEFEDFYEQGKEN